MIRPGSGQDHSNGLRDMNSPKGRTDGMNGDTKGCGRPNDTTRGELRRELMD